jgi:hypothetical protein
VSGFTRAAGPWLLGLIFAALIGLYAVLACDALRAPGIRPAFSDEVGYYLDVRSFCENDTLHGVLLLEERVAPWGDFGLHGFAYTLLDGSIARLIGLHPGTRVCTNLLWLTIALALIFGTVELRVAQRLMIGSLVLGYFLVPIMAFGYMQESLQVLFTVCAGLLLRKVYSQGSRLRWPAMYCGLLLIAAVFRPTWLLFTVGLFPAASGVQARVAVTVTVLVALATAFVMSVFLTAPFSYGFLPQAMDTFRNHGWIAFLPTLLEHFIDNTTRYFTETGPAASYYLGSKYLFVALQLVLLIWGWRRHRPFAVATALIGLTNLAALLLLYDAFGWREQRFLAPCYYLAVITIVSEVGLRPAAVFALLFSVAVLPEAVTFSRKLVAKRQTVAAQIVADGPQLKALRSVASVVDRRRLITILCSRALFNESFLPSLPVRSRSGVPIRYTFNLRGDEFTRFGRLKIDYLLTTGSRAPSGCVPVLIASEFRLYEFPN